jgi:uroporphyrinogen-III synthase
MTSRPLAGRRIVTTRDEPGALDAVLTRAGAEVVFVPLIEIRDAPDGGDALGDALRNLADFDWLIVTSKHGARRVGRRAAECPNLTLAAVGTATADELSELAGRRPDVVPARQTAKDLVAAMPRPRSGGQPDHVLVAQGDLADATLADGLRSLGYAVDVVIAYSTVERRPTLEERSSALAADAVAFASGSAAVAWAQSIGPDVPPVVVAIGPTTQRAAIDAGLKVTHVAADHTVEGLVAEITVALTARS